MRTRADDRPENVSAGQSGLGFYVGRTHHLTVQDGVRKPRRPFFDHRDHPLADPLTMVIPTAAVCPRVGEVLDETGDHMNVFGRHCGVVAVWG